MLQPDLVVLSGSMESHGRIREPLKQIGTEQIILNYDNYDDFINLLDLFERIIGKKGRRITALPP